MMDGVADPRPLDRAERLIAEARSLRALAAHLAADPATADDLVQDTWVAALRRAPPDGPLNAWLARVLRNFAKKRRRAEMRQSDREHRMVEARQVATPDHIAERIESQRVLIDVLSKLDEPLRTTVVLRYFEELSSVEIARMHGVPEGTVRWRLKRALDELRVQLDARFGGSRSGWCVLFAPLVSPNTPAAIAPSSATAAAMTTEGAIAVGTMTKIGAALAVAALGGWAWWSSEGAHAPALPPSPTEAVATEELGSIDVPLAVDDAASPATRRVEAAKSTRPWIAETVAQLKASQAKTVEQVVDVRFVAANGVPWQRVRFWATSDAGNVVESSSDGRATLRLSRPENDPVRHLDFVATRAGCATASLGATLHLGEALHLGDVVLVPSVTLRGRVVDERGRGIAEAEVGLSAEKLQDDDLAYIHRLGSPSFERGVIVAAESDGFFALGGIAPGRWRLWAKADGTRYGWTEPFDVSGDDLQGFELVLAPMRASDQLVGRVVDPRGAPVPKARLWIHYSLDIESGTIGRDADDEGRFDFVIWRDTVYTLVAADPEHRWVESSLEHVTPGTGELLLQLGEPKTLEVRVHDPSRTPLEGCELSVHREAPNHSPEAHVKVLAAGRYQLEMPGYTCHLDVRATGYRPRTLGPYAPGAVPPTLDVELVPLPVIRGRVVGNAGPVAGAEVGLYATVRGMLISNGFDCIVERTPRAKVVTDAQGRYVIGCDLEREFYVRAEADGFAASERGPLATPANERVIDLELTHGGSIEGRVIYPVGESAEGAIVGISRGDGRARTGRAGPDGRYRFDGLAPGKWQVLLRTEEIRPDRSISASDDSTPDKVIEWSCEVVAGKTTTFDVVNDAR